MPVERAELRLIAALLCVVAVFTVGLWLPNVSRAQELREEILKLEKDLGVSRDRSDDLARLAHDVDRLREKMASTNKVIPEQGELAGFLRELSVQIDQEQLTDQGLSTGSIREGDEYTTLPVELTFSGNSLAVFRFVNRVEEMPRLVQVDRLVVEDGPEDGRVQVEMDLNTFFYTTEEGKR